MIPAQLTLIDYC